MKLLNMIALLVLSKLLLSRHVNIFLNSSMSYYIQKMNRIAIIVFSLDLLSIIEFTSQILILVLKY
jgi:hypothetical protein